MSSNLHWTPEQLEEYRARFCPESEPPKKPKKPRARKSPSAPPRAHADPVPAPALPDPSTLPDYSPASIQAPRISGWNGKQTETEKRYNAQHLHGLGRFEAVTLILPGGGRYTPDFMTVDDGRVTFHEVKGSYRLGSQGRAYTAFHEAAASFPCFRFVWAQERRGIDGGGFAVKTFEQADMVEGRTT